MKIWYPLMKPLPMSSIRGPIIDTPWNLTLPMNIDTFHSCAGNVEKDPGKFGTFSFLNWIMPAGNLRSLLMIFNEKSACLCVRN